LYWYFVYTVDMFFDFCSFYFMYLKIKKYSIKKKESLIRLKRVWFRLFSDIWHQHVVHTDAHPLLAIEMKSAHPQWRRWRNLAHFRNTVVWDQRSRSSDFEPAGFKTKRYTLSRYSCLNYTPLDNNFVKYVIPSNHRMIDNRGNNNIALAVKEKAVRLTVFIWPFYNTIVFVLDDALTYLHAVVHMVLYVHHVHALYACWPCMLAAATLSILHSMRDARPACTYFSSLIIIIRW
jgi:hypothetical protein